MNQLFWNKEIQKDLKLLQNQYKLLGYNLTKEQCYNTWSKYSDWAYANWLIIDNFHIKKSIKFIE